MKDLHAWLLEAGVVPEQCSGTNAFARLVSDSRDAKAGDCFVAMPSANTDTAQFLPQVAQQGCRCAVVSTAAAYESARNLGLSVAHLPSRGQSFLASLGRLCRVVFDDPSQDMRMIAVTGTNGKTTTAWLIRHALKALGRQCGYLGTLGIQTSGDVRELNNTTPFSVELWDLLAEAKQAGCQDLVMEASSHALYQRRLAGVSFDCGTFTNLTQDHLDFHGSMEAYAEAKKLLYTEYAMASRKAFVGAISHGDPYATEWLADLPCRCLTYGIGAGDLPFAIDHVGLESIAGRVGNQPFEAGVGGQFNASNLSSVAATLHVLGYSDDEIARGLNAAKPVPGRFETIPNERGVGVLVDYAHTPDALEKLLQSARELNPKRVITVFGCGGDRDRTKRPKMAFAASRLSDVTVITSDNPRTEDPESIVQEVATGITPGAEHTTVIDRREAITHAVHLAQEGDIVVIAGKGHENYQIIGRTKHPMDDRDMARDALESKP